MIDMKRLEAEFNDDMRRILTEERKVNLHSARFAQMIEQYGGVEAAHRLLMPNRELPPNTFGYLRTINRRDLTMEYYVVLEKYSPLFTQEERDIAKWRLENED
jgi:hypothetical protein